MKIKTEKLQALKVLCDKYKGRIDTLDFFRTPGLEYNIFEKAIEIFYPKSIWGHVEKQRMKYQKKIEADIIGESEKLID